MQQTHPTLPAIKKELEKERDRIKVILKRRTHADPKIKGNYIADFPNTGDDLVEEEDQVFKDVEYEERLAIEHVLEKRLQKVEEDLKKIEEGAYEI